MISHADLQHEQMLRVQGYRLIAGLDEAGRGAWAGPVVAGAVILPLESDNHADLAQALAGVNDSKLLSRSAREALLPKITSVALATGVGFASHEEIDTLGIVPATRLAMQRALAALCAWPDALLTDALALPEVDLPCIPLIKGDRRSLSIAAASILAKVTRDEHMRALDSGFPGYYFGQHKGYGTSLHSRALVQLGPSPVHRKTFAPVRALLNHLQDKSLTP